MSTEPFGVIFVGHSIPISSSKFRQVDATHWVLDIGGAVTADHQLLKEVVLFLGQPLNPELGLALYVALGDGGWMYRGHVTSAHPSDVFPLQWPLPEPGAQQGALVGRGGVQLGIAVEPLAELQQKEGSKVGAKADFAKESFGVQQAADKLLVPANCIERWFQKFSDKFRRDPDFLTREKAELG